MNMSQLLPVIIIVGIIVCAILVFVWMRIGKKSQANPRQLPSTQVKADVFEDMKLFKRALFNLRDRVDALENNKVLITQKTPVAVVTGPVKPQLKEYSLSEAITQATSMEVSYSGNGSHPVEQEQPETVEVPAESRQVDMAHQIVAILENKAMKTGDVAKSLNLKSQNVSKLLIKMFEGGIIARNAKDEWVLSGTK